MSKKKKVNHVLSKDGTTWCGKKKAAKGTAFDADPCSACQELVRESITEGAK